jgi:DNA polymerase-3 subunit alpha
VARVFEVNHFKVNGLSKQIEDSTSFDTVPELAAFAKEYPMVVNMAKELDGTIRQSGVHACGVCISSRPLREVCAVERRKDVMVSSWDSSVCEDFGLLKMDVLGLTTLTILKHAAKLVKDNYDIVIDYPKLPLDDPRSMELFSRGDCKGIFQFEADQMQQLLRKLGASDFETCTACTALHRPGPLQAGLTEKYAAIVQGKREESYPCPQLQPILGMTKSIIVYQEQVMRIFTDLGGFSMAHADKMRKIIGKKLGKDEFDKHRADFVGGCDKNGIPSQVADDLFNDMAEFAAYSFNLAHAAAYTMLSVWSMYMKANYPAEFLASYMSCVKSEDSVGEMVADSRKMNVPVTRPDINISTNNYELDGGTILAPLGAIKGVGEKAVEAILEARKDGPFLSVDDMRERVNRRAVNVRIVELLQRAGAFERLGVIEENEEQREKNYNELLPMLAEIPTMSLDHPGVADLSFSTVSDQIEAWANTSNLKPMYPEFGTQPSIMAINMPLKGERKLLTKQSTMLFTKTLQEYGISRKNIYYTSLLKCVHEDPAKAKKSHMSTGIEIVKQEIAIVKPKLIVVFAAQAIPLFAPDGKMGKLNGRVVYSKVYDCYVMFSWSPQYAAYKTEEIGPAFRANMVKISEMFGVI